MSEREQFLATVPVFSGMSADELAVVGEIAEEEQWEAGTEIYADGDASDSMFVVMEGAVEIYDVVGGIEKLFMTVRSGTSFGLQALIDAQPRAGYARALESTEVLAFKPERCEGLIRDHPEIGVKLLRGVATALGNRSRVLLAQYRATVAWNLEVTGLATLNLERLMTERVEVVVETTRGEPLAGTLVRFEASAAGHELYLQSADKEVHVIPYHAIVRISVDASSHREPADG